MRKNSKQYLKLFNQLLEKNLSPHEVEILINWLGKKKLDTKAAELIMKQLKQPIDSEQIDLLVVANLEKRLQIILATKNSTPRVRSLYTMRWVRYAAIFVLLISAIGINFFLKHKQTAGSNKSFITKISNITPGKNGAILTLANGKTVIINSSGNSFIANQNGSKALLKNGQLIYSMNRNSEANEVMYNTITTPRGRQFQLMLSDGTKVWLNAASSLRYPTAFIGKERNVEITGEAYFEVAKNAKMPFHVKINNKAEVEVLGTHFDISAYDNESDINTTLLEGLVRFYYGNEKAILKPGQQAQVSNTNNSAIKVNNNIDVDKVMAWKSGIFYFNDATLEEVMRQIERWYDIDVVYEKGVPPFEFVGKMQRNLNLSEVLHGLEISKVHFKLEGRKLIVLP